MDRGTGTTMKPITSASTPILLILATQCHVQAFHGKQSLPQPIYVYYIIYIFIYLYVFIVCHSENKCSHVLIHWAVYILFGNAQRSNPLDSFVMPKRRVHERAPRTAETAEEKEQETEQVKDSVIGHSVLSTEAGLMHRETTGCKGATA